MQSYPFREIVRVSGGTTNRCSLHWTYLWEKKMSILIFATRIELNFHCISLQIGLMNYNTTFSSWNYENWEKRSLLRFPVFMILQFNLNYVFRCTKTWTDNFIKCCWNRRSNIFLSYFRKHIPSTLCLEWQTKFHSHRAYTTAATRLIFANILRLIKSRMMIWAKK
jgi:hypothetical protein